MIVRRVWIPALLSAACASAPADLPEPEWHLLPSGSVASLRGLAAVSADVAWATGSGGTVLLTRDAGRTWRQVAPPESAAADFRDVAAWSADEAVVMIAGEPAQLWRTSDAGASWRLVFAEAAKGAFFDALAVRGDEVVLMGDPLGGMHYVRTSADRGVSWSTPDLARLPSPLAGEAGFAASGTCVVAFGVEDFAIATGGGADARFLRSTRSAAVLLPLQAGAASRGAFSVAFAADERRGVVVGGDYAAPEVAAGCAAYSADGGRSWHAAQSGPSGYRSAVAWLTSDVAIATGPTGSSVTGDAGRTWRPFGAVGFHCLAVADGVVWAAGSEGRIARLPAGTD